MSARSVTLCRRVAQSAFLLLLVPVVARAGDQGGTESIFAEGAGNRALAMGSAFVAAADDASSIFWNPAGLALVQRFEIETAQANDGGLGLREGHAAVVAPSWRWGTFALSMRYFNVGGIEARDARNVPGDEFANGEIEFALGYGRTLGSSVAVGGAVKLQRQSLAGFAASALGVDVGVSMRPAAVLGMDAPWAQPWTWAVTVRNLVEPGLRLDRDVVTDPLALTTGLAWTHAAGPVGDLVAEVDIGKTRDLAPVLRAGLELRPHPMFALRAGGQGNGFSAGTGLRWRNVSVDYSYRDLPLASDHRMGLSWRFGPSLAESRLASSRKEDERVAEKLAEALREQQDQQIADLLRKASEAHAAGDHDAALEALAAARTLNPEDTRLAPLEYSCLTDKARSLESSGDHAAAAIVFDRALAAMPGDSIATAGAARCRTESDRRSQRSARARERFAQAMDAFAADDLLVARAGFASVLSELPADVEANGMLHRTEEAIARRAAALVDQAQRYLRAGLVNEATPLLERAAQLDPSARELADATAAVLKAKQGARAAAPEPASRSTFSRARPRRSDGEIEQLYRQGIIAYQQKRPDDALRFWELVWSSRPGYRGVNELLKKEYLTRGIEAYASGQVEEAAIQWQKAVAIDPSDKRARGYLERAEHQLARTHKILKGGR